MAEIGLVLAAGPGRPEGDMADRITLRADLTTAGYLDIAAWFAEPSAWTFSRVGPGGDTEGSVVRVGEAWALQGRQGADAPLWQFAPRILRPGEYATLRSPVGEDLVFRVVSVAPAAA